MLLKSCLAFLAVITITISDAQSDVTFKNVTVQAYSVFTHKFNVTIQNSNNLKEHLPKKIFDMLEITDAQIPVLYEDAISGIDDLDELILKHNGITKIQPGALKNLPQLRKLVIIKNSIRKISGGMFNHLKSIATLDLSDNGIVTVAPDTFDNMPELLNIKLSDNKIQHWDKNWFSNTPLLTRVSMQHNLIQEIPSTAFGNFKGDKKFGSVDLTINIILSENQISKIHQDAFEGLKKINNLWLDNNQLTEWNEIGTTKVKDLRLEDNQLKCFPEDLGKILVAETTSIDGNPWDCECLDKIKKWAAKNSRTVTMFYAGLTCDAARIDQKLKKLEERLRELKADRIEKNEDNDKETTDVILTEQNKPIK